MTVAAPAPRPRKREKHAESKEWTPAELARLRQLAPRGGPFVAAALGRSHGAVRNMAWRCGIVLSQPPTDATWTSADLAQLRRVASLGLDGASAVLGRSPTAVRAQAFRQRISLRRPGEHRGRSLGDLGRKLQEAQKVRALRQLREDVLAGRVDIVRIERRLRLISKGADLCPACGMRPIEIPRTGMCEDCHLRGLAAGHRAELTRSSAERELDRERQRKHRGGGS